MIAEIGLAALWLAAALAVLQMVSGAMALRAPEGEAAPLAIYTRPAAVVQAFLAVLAFLLLLAPLFHIVLLVPSAPSALVYRPQRQLANVGGVSTGTYLHIQRTCTKCLPFEAHLGSA